MELAVARPENESLHSPGIVKGLLYSMVVYYAVLFFSMMLLLFDVFVVFVVGEKLWKRVCAEITTEIVLLAENWKYLLGGLVCQVSFDDEIFFFLWEFVCKLNCWYPFLVYLMFM